LRAAFEPKGVFAHRGAGAEFGGLDLLARERPKSRPLFIRHPRPQGRLIQIQRRLKAVEGRAWFDSPLNENCICCRIHKSDPSIDTDYEKAVRKSFQSLLGNRLLERVDHGT
jgi:hypothetical protein